MRPPVILLTFANNNEENLKELNAEKAALADLFVEKQSQGYFLFDNNTMTVEKLRHQLFKYKPQVCILHYAGHANGSQLLFEDQKAYSSGLMESIKDQTNLKLVFLNGCSTKGQVENLLKNGVPAVIATSVKVNDTTARLFAVDFYKNLIDGKTILEAFKIASEIVTSKDGSSVNESKRSLGYAIGEEEEENSDAIAWGLYIGKKKEVLDWKLPDTSYYELIIKSKIGNTQNADIEGNSLLLQTLYNVLMTFSDDLEMFKELGVKYEKQGNIEDFDIREVKNAIINSLPSPIGEQVRKLLVPEDNNDDELPEEARLRFLINTYSVMVDLLTFIMLSQLWDVYEKRKPKEESKDSKEISPPPLLINDNLKEMIKDFFLQEAIERQGHDAIPLIAAIRELFIEQNVNFFVDEIIQLKELIDDANGEFFKAYIYLKDIKNKYKDINNISANFGENEIKKDCAETENQLCSIFKELGFCAKYKFATIKDINIVKKKNEPPIFKHKMVKLDYVLVGFADKNQDFDNFTDSKAVIIYKIENKKVEAFNLYPFVIDINALLEENLSKIYFFSHYTHTTDIETNCTYKFVKNINREKDSLQIPLKDDFFNAKRGLKLSVEETNKVFNETLETIEEFILNFK